MGTVVVVTNILSGRSSRRPGSAGVNSWACVCCRTSVLFSLKQGRGPDASNSFWLDRSALCAVCSLSSEASGGVAGCGGHRGEIPLSVKDP